VLLMSKVLDYSLGFKNNDCEVCGYTWDFT